LRNILFNILLLLGSLALTFWLLEVVLRMFPTLGTRSGTLVPPAKVHTLGPAVTVFQPGYSGTLVSRDFRVELRTNSLGFREEEIDFPSLARARPYLFLGDSYFYGWGVSVEARVSARFHELLEASDRAGPVVNFSSPGFGTYQNLEVLRRFAPQLRPRMVVIGFFIGNDFLDDRKSLLKMAAPGAEKPDGGAWPRVKSRVRSSLNNSRCVNIAKTALWKFKRFRQIFNALEIRNDRIDFYDPGRGMELYEATFSALDGIAEWSRANSVPVLVVVIPDHLQVVSEDVLDGYEFSRPQSLLWAHLYRAGIPSLDLLEPLRRSQEKESLYFSEDKHWTEQGHDFAARQLAAYVLDSRVEVRVDRITEALEE
jgi:hypothetical protein